MNTQTVTASDGHAFELRWNDCTANDRAFVIFPALGVRATYYDLLAEAFAKAGVTAVISELRGQGSSSLRASRSCDWSYEDHVARDWPAAIKAVSEKVNGPIWLLGHSMGGQLSTIFLGRNPEAVAGLVTIATGTNYYRNWRPPESLKILAQTQIVALLVRALGFFPGQKLGFGGLQARSEMIDWAANARHGNYGNEDAIARVSRPVWAFSLEGDRLAPPRAARHLAAKFKNSTHRHLTSDDLPRECLHHFAWARNPDAVVALLAKTVAQRTSKP